MRPAKRSARKRQRFLARAYIDFGLFEIDPSLATLLVQGATAKTIMRSALEPRKLQRDLGLKVEHQTAHELTSPPTDAA